MPRDHGPQLAPRACQPGLKPLAQVKNVIAVASGKGGVGKSTTAANLAIALKEQGANVGLVDADIYGPSQTKMLGNSNKPAVDANDKFIPLRAHGLQWISMGSLIDQKTAMVWRGPIASKAVRQLIFDTAWEALDYLILDLPPGTGDIQLTLAQKVPLSGAVVITTPQEIALMDVRRAYEMFEKVNVPTLGIVENMSYFICGHCATPAYIFGKGGGQVLANELSLPLLGEIPLEASVCEQAEKGVPFAIAHPDSAITQAYASLAQQMINALKNRPFDYSHRFPDVKVEG